MQFSGESHEPPTPEQLADWQRRGGPPDHEVGVSLAWSGVLGRAPDIAVLVTGAAVYSTGIQLQIAVRARTSSPGGALFQAVDGHRGGSDRLLLGVEFADGRAGAIADGGAGWPPPPLPADAPSLTSGGGGGSDRSVDLGFFLHPLPPPGPVAIVCAWPGRDIPETRTEFTGAAEAVTGVIELWPPEPFGPPDEPEPPRPPDVPDGGWFARVLDR